MHRTASKVVIPNLSESLKICKLGNQIRLIYKIKLFLTYFIFLTFLYFLWTWPIGACRMQTDRSTNKQTNRQTISRGYTPKNWRTYLIYHGIRAQSGYICGVICIVYNQCVCAHAYSCDAADIQYIFLVGGLSESTVVQQDLRQSFSARVQVFVPNEASLAVLKGIRYLFN